ncbi:carotenoid oxygenase [Micractinium conductrix]|uniref:Carotenoid oxygenase n=1 Tax=Micractinium conductrix TaxID=554055 RepID=A0A2P6VHZ7_9CHLO|nr:carotenoid oxygenase [Micractinium conductrix]|eukprot:PSC73715.1 carotenoid oxygenase [Micractinium conductrix]
MSAAQPLTAASAGGSAATTPPAALRSRPASRPAAAASPPVCSLQHCGQQHPRHTAAAAAAVPASASPPASAQQADIGSRFDQSDWDAFLRGYRSQHVEHAYWVEEGMVEGTIPAELEGTLLRNGPGLFEVGGAAIPQPFDGDGMIAMLAFQGGKAFFANRYVRTEGFVKEQAAQRLLYRGAFSVGNPAGAGLYNPFDLSVKGIANTGVVHWGGKLLALYERDLPYELSTPDLKTRGQTLPVPSKAPYFGAHYRILQESDGSRRLVAFNAEEAGQTNRINMFEYDESLKMVQRIEFELPDAAFGFFHDFLVTQNYYIFLENPMSLDLWKVATQYMLGRACIAECIAWDGGRKKTRVHLIPRPGGAAAGGADPAAGRRTFETSPFFSFHHANAFEAAAAGGGGGGAPTKVVIDTVANHDGIDFGANFETGPSYYNDDVGRGTLTRVVLDLQAGTASQHRLMDRACEFPCVAPAVTGRPHRHTYLVGSRFAGAETWGAPQAVCKVSLDPEAGVAQPCGPQAVQQDVYYPGRTCFAQEPIFVPRPGGQAEDDGWVMSLVFDADSQRTSLVILDARQLSAGPVATIKLPHMLPMGLHGSWSGQYLGPAPGQPYPTSTYDVRQGVAPEP